MPNREEVLLPLLNKRQEFKAKVSRITHDKVLLIDVTINDDTFDHCWVPRNRLEKKEGTKTNFMIYFTAVPYTYIGLDEDDQQVTKCGLKGISKVKYLYKLRKGQR